MKQRHLFSQIALILILVLCHEISLAQMFTQLGSDIDGEAGNDFSGYSVSLSSSGNIVAIGAISNAGNNVNAGHVRVYELINNSWVQLGSDIDGEAAGDFSGHSVSLSSNGSIIAIGAKMNSGNGANAGHVRVYELINNSWVQLGSDIDGEAAGDFSGQAVSLSSNGSILAVGAGGNDANGSYSGHVRVYELINNSWVQLGSDIDGEAAGDQSGSAISLSSDGSILAVGANGNDGGTGHVRVYEYLNNSWVQLGDDINGEAAGDVSGGAVSLSQDGNILAIGATGNDAAGSSAGHVRVFEFSNNSWIQLGSDIDGEAADDWSGSAVSLSSDGSILAIGAYKNDENGTEAGHVRIYEYINNSWEQLGSDIDGEAAGDRSGLTVSFSSNGRIIAIGAPENDGNGTDAGHVRVYLKGLILNQPNNAIACKGEDILLGLTAFDTTCIYTWQTDSGTGFSNLSNSGQFTGVDSDTLKVSNVNTDNFQQLFRCIITYGSQSDTSDVIIFIPAFEIISQPQDTTTTTGNSIYFVTTTSDSLASYQWQRNNGSGFNDIQNGGQFNGANTNSLSISSISIANNNEAYRCIITSGTCQDTTDIAVLSVINGIMGNVPNGINIYPNPTKDKLTLSVDQKHIGSTCLFTTIHGQILNEFTIDAESKTINLQSLPIGIYIIRVSDIYCKRIVRVN